MFVNPLPVAEFSGIFAHTLTVDVAEVSPWPPLTVNTHEKTDFASDINWGEGGTGLTKHLAALEKQFWS